jgi:hypothetical protein
MTNEPDDEQPEEVEPDPPEHHDPEPSAREYAAYEDRYFARLFNPNH